MPVTNLKPDNEDAENEEKLLANYNTKKKYRQVRGILAFKFVHTYTFDVYVNDVSLISDGDVHCHNATGCRATCSNLLKKTSGCVHWQRW